MSGSTDSSVGRKFAKSFGHHQAKQYRVQEGWKRDMTEEQIQAVKHGFCVTRQSVTKLLHKVVEQLIQERINAVGLSVCGRWVTDNGSVVQHDIETVTKMLDAGFLPVLHGDCVLDGSKGSAILSGDTIIQTLCRTNSVKRVVFLTSVQGIFDKPPEISKDARLIEDITVDRAGTLSFPSKPKTSIEMTTPTHDVTGGMSKKLQSAVNIVSSSEGQTVVYVCEITSSFAHYVTTQGTESQSLHESPGTQIQYVP